MSDGFRELKLSDLEIVAHLLHSLSFTKTADAFGTSVSRVSKVTKRVEEALGVDLLYRSGNAVTLAPAAASFMASVTAGLRGMEGLATLRPTDTGVVRIAHDPIIPACDFSLWTDFGTTHAQLLTVASPFAEEFAERGVFDLGLFMGSTRCPPGWESVSLAATPFFHYVRKPCSQVTTEALACVALGTLSRAGLLARHDLILRDLQHYRALWQVVDMQDALRLLIGTDCCMGLPATIESSELAAGLRRLNDDVEHRDLVLVYRPEHTLKKWLHPTLRLFALSSAAK